MQQDINNSIEALNAGGVILYPTDTIWGIGCDATNDESVKKIYQIKKREDSKSLIVLVNNIHMLLQYIEEIPEIAYDLIEVTNKPLTIIYPKAKNLSKFVVNEDGSIAIRIVNSEFCQQLISKFRKPIVSTSANISGKTSPSNFSQIDENVIKRVDYVVKFKQNDNKKSVPSSIIKLNLKGQFVIIRK